MHEASNSLRLHLNCVRVYLVPNSHADSYSTLIERLIDPIHVDLEFHLRQSFKITDDRQEMYV